MTDKLLLDSISGEIGEMLAQQDAGEKIPPVTCTIEYGLEPEHLAEYVEQFGSLQTTVKSDQKDVHVLRAQHHGIARLLATNLPESVVAEMTGYSKSYISTLKNSPSMAELIAHYRMPGNLAAMQITEKLRTVAMGALEKLGDKLGSEELTPEQLIALAKLGFDRSDHGPQSKHTEVHEHRVYDVAALEKLNREARRSNLESIVPIEEVRRALPAPSTPSEEEAA